MPMLSDAAAAYAQRRGISRATLERLGVASGTVFFPELERKSEALFFPYAGGTHWKARSFPDKAFVSNKGFELEFWGFREFLSARPGVIYVAEGELDRCALVEAGFGCGEVLSVPNGARAQSVEDHAELRLRNAYVLDALRAGLDRVDSVVWCGDSDGAGHSLRSDMVRLFGAARFKYVDWPEGAKDANDLLRADGAEALREYVEQSARPWPVAGLYRLSEIPEPAPVRTWSTGFRLWDEHVRLAPSTLSVLTGFPGHGKTVFCAQLFSQIVRQYDLVACVASFETRAKPHLRRHLRTAYHRRLERELSADERSEADRWINNHYVFLVHPDQRPTLEWFLDVSEVAVVRHGASVVLLDPWNRLEGARERGEHEVDYIQRCLRALHSFALDMRVHVQVVAHPSKMDSTRRGKAPELEDISGPRAWDSMPDQGFCVYRPKLFDGLERRTEAHFYHLKARMDELGYPCRLDIRYEPTTGMFYPEMAPAKQTQRDMGLGLGDVSDLGRNI